MFILDTFGRCFMKTQHDLSVTATLKVHTSKPQTFTQRTVVTFKHLLIGNQHRNI